MLSPAVYVKSYEQPGLNVNLSTVKISGKLPRKYSRATTIGAASIVGTHASIKIVNY